MSSRREWTAAQREAIYSDGSNLIVSAAAGSGKTAVLTERIARLVEEGAGIDRFLVVTFTEAATAEMKRRIARRLYEAARLARLPEDGVRLHEQALMAARANISTLHAFCLYILRRNFHLVGLDPAFRPADELLSGLLFGRAIEETALARYEARDGAFIELMRALGGEDALFDTVRRLYTFLFAQPEPFQWLKTHAAVYLTAGEALKVHPAMTAYLSVLKDTFATACETLLGAREKIPPQLHRSLAVIDDDLAQIRALLLCGDIEKFQLHLQAIKFQNSYWPRGEYLPIKNEIYETRDAVRKEVYALKDSLRRDIAQEAALLNAFAPQVETLSRFIVELHEQYGALKRARAVVDFADMEHLALRALSHEPVRTALQKRFLYVFVDEYQDSSHIQERVIQQITGGGNLFLVGDIKQSIYRFRQADPELFIEKLKTYTGTLHKGVSGKAIYLNNNFRSASPILNAVNAVFSRIMNEHTGEIAYDDNAALHPPQDKAADEPADEPVNEPEGAYANEAIDKPIVSSPAPNGCELHVIAHAGDQDGAPEEMVPPAADEEDMEEAYGDAELEAILCAGRIQELMRGPGFYDARLQKTRPLRYADFAILLRAQKDVAQTWARTMVSLGVPVYVQTSGGYFDAMEVQVFLNLLRLIDNIRQDIPLLSVLRSPMFQFGLVELVELKTEYVADTLYERLALCAGGDTPLGCRAQAFFDKLTAWRKERRLLPLHMFMAQLLDETGFYDCVGALPAGRERQGNLDALLGRAQAFAESGGAADLWSFLTFMDTAASTARLGPAQAGAADVVRILSMHAAKGLEYPVVFLAGLGRPFVKQEMQRHVLFERELGIGVRFVEDHVRYDTLLRRAIAARLLRQQLAEEMRVLYVGMTRARNKLILVGCAKNAKEKLREEALPFTSARCAAANSFMDWLIPVSRDCDCLQTMLHRRDALQAPQAESVRAGAQDENAANAICELRQRLAEWFAWRYRYPDAAGIPTKRSVSELMETHEIILRESPAFTLADKALTPTQRGEAVHALLRHLRLRDCAAGQEEAFVRRELSRMRRERLLSLKQCAVIDIGNIIWFLRSPAGMRLRSAARVERELDFSVELPANELMDTPSSEPVMLQGVLDCCFLENGAWVVLDFKTDYRIAGGNASEAAQGHARQLRLYALALTMLTGLPVKEGHVVMLSYNESVAIALDD
ncbi:MAG: UvrD-helicase domain-containing protein [Clostridiales bacterium]|jgi:ATP-dependent helicase/nuclease subunit A|nr:UvrD-helicase domain-containing protein [Clostridiales bacterium]